MPSKLRQQYLQAAKEIRSQLNSQPYRFHPPEKAFVEWYKVARFGTSGQIRLLDGKSDGGIDALIQNNVRHLFFNLSMKSNHVYLL